MPALWWSVFGLVVAVLLILDLGIFKKKTRELTLREALYGLAIRVGFAVFFNVAIYLGWIGAYETAAQHQQAGVEFLTGYLVEIALSIDNVFVFAVVFRYFQVPPHLQHRVLFWGILGALVMRAILIFAGIALLNTFHWVIYIFAIILIYGGVKMIRSDNTDVDPEQNPVLKIFRRFVPVTPEFEGERFLTKRNDRIYATPLCVVLLVIETTDLVFAIDSIPAVLAVTQDPFIVFTSNVFAILGLRALYFALAGILRLFRFLHYGLSGILIFVGVKMLLSHTPYKLQTEQSLAVVGAFLIVSVVASLLIPEKKKDAK